MEDGILHRLYIKSLSNQVAITVGSSCSSPEYSIPAIAEAIINTFNISFPVDHPLQFFERWNELVSKTQEVIGREKLIEFVHNKVRDAEPSPIHHNLAAIPISNFIDTTFDRSLYKALVAAGKKPILHDWQSQMMGSWKQTNPETPNLFFMLPSSETPSFYGIYEPAGKDKNNRIQLTNIGEMLSERDLVLIDFSAFEAECVLHLHSLVITCEKIVNYTVENGYDSDYWAQRGVCIRPVAPQTLIDRLIPYGGRQYTSMDMMVPRRKLIDAAREKQYDCFISYFSGDKGFVSRLEQDLRLREIHTWRDDIEIEIGDSITDKIQEGLSDSYSFMIVLSPDALSRPWVKEELRAAYALRLAGEFKILPILHKECEIPPFLVDYKYADFRDQKRYHEQVALLERSIKNAVKRAREKK
jgi:hypothetical protein